MQAIHILCAALVLAGPAFGRSLLQAPAPATSLSDTDILNFALNLEYLEAEFYQCAANGSPLPSDLRGGGPASTGCTKANLGPVAQQVAEEVARNEVAHVTLLRQALGDDAVPIPQLNIGSAFADAADAAFGQSVSPAFSPYLNDLFFYLGAFLFEDVGVTAYLGAAPLIENSTYLSTAAKISAVEAYHAGIIRTFLFQSADATTPYNVTIAEVVEAVSNLRDEADGSNSDDDQGIVRTTSDGEVANLVPADDDALAFARTPEQVIDIVTLGQGQKGGGLFPNGLNGFFGPADQETEQ